MKRMTRKSILTFIFVALGVMASESQAQFTANFQTNTVSGVTSNWVGNGTYVVGTNFTFDALRIINGGVLSNGTGYIGFAVGGSNNVAVVMGTGSILSWCSAKFSFISPSTSSMMSFIGRRR